MSVKADAVSALIQDVDSKLRAECISNPDLVTRLILSACREITPTSASPLATTCAHLKPSVFKTLVALADEQINNVDFRFVSPRWVGLYVDAHILSAMYDLWAGAPRAIIVRQLDLAIIVGGATQPGRMQWIQQAIKLAQPDRQEGRNPQRQVGDTNSPLKRRRLDVKPEVLFAYKAVPSLTTPPSLERYLTHHRDEPFVLRGYFTDGNATAPWPACVRWKEPGYLLSKVGRDRCVPVEEGTAYDDINWGQRIVSFEDFLARAGFYGPNHDLSAERPMYLAQHSLFRQFPELELDMHLPDYVWSDPTAPASFPSYRAPTTEDGVIVNVWVGSGSGEIVSPAHTDPYYNCYVQVLGQKRVWLAPPKCSPHMACHGEDPHGNGGGDSSVSQYMVNTSTVPILRSDVTLHGLETEYPMFKRQVQPYSMETILGPGDLLVMPPGWWHAMRGEGTGPGWSVSMWY